MSTKTLDRTTGGKAAATWPRAGLPDASLIQRLAPEDQVLLTKLLTEPMDFVDHPDFADPHIEEELFGGPARLVHRAATRFVEHEDAITDAVQAGERVPALNYEQEAHLFKRFNYARFKVNEILRRYAGKKLPAAATRQLLAWGHRVLATRSVIVRLNMPLVLAMAKRTKLNNVDFNEMISEGNMALLRSVEKFDCSRGYKFSTYSCRAILKAFSRVAMRASRYRGQFPTEFDPAMERSDYLERRRENIEEDCVDELKRILLNNLAGLSEVERTVIRERFALGPPLSDQPTTPKTLEQVGHIIGVTKERVRQIQNTALKKIRLALEEEYLAA
ncbi:MAG: sigma-70 family RNA polymerase sigma factor [Planctomycetota bacterium]|nr:MAG: sigma-70 family RNA polymerase sigma factor [Planctomycetota bacterium]